MCYVVSETLAKALLFPELTARELLFSVNMVKSKKCKACDLEYVIYPHRIQCAFGKPVFNGFRPIE